jgi:dTMP kinase
LKKKAIIVSFEGIDGSGKTTQAKKFVEFLKKQGKDVIFLKEPGTTYIGEKIRSILLSKTNKINPLSELFLYLAARNQLYHEIIKKNLDKKSVIVFDRFFDSTVAYQGYGRNLPIDFIENLNKITLEDISTDLTFIIDIPAEELQQYIKEKGADRLEKSLAFQKRVRNGYLEIAKKEPKRIKLIKRETFDKTFQQIVKLWEKFLIEQI